MRGELLVGIWSERRQAWVAAPAAGIRCESCDAPYTGAGRCRWWWREDQRLVCGSCGAGYQLARERSEVRA